MTDPNRRYVRACGFLLRTLACTLAGCASLLAQNPPQLQITAPASNAVFSPGQAMPVTVTSPDGTAFTSVGVIGEDPLGLSNTAASLPAQFSFAVPANIDCRQYTLAAQGLTTSGGTIQSAPITVDIEHSDPALQLSASLAGLVFQIAGERSTLSFTGTFSNNAACDVTGSTMMSYISSDSSVATVSSSTGRLVVTSVGPGNTTIIATYGQGATSISLTIPLAVSLPLTASPSSIRFAAQGVGTSSGPQTITLLNSSNSAINISAAVANGDFSQTNTCIASSPLSPGGTCTITVTFSPTLAGTRSGTVAISDDSNPSSLNLPLTGIGLVDFSLAATPPTQSVRVKSSTSYTVSVSPIGGFTGAVSLTASGVPGSTTATFNPASISGGSGTSTLKITTSSKTPLGNFTLGITGTSGALTHTANVTLTVTR